MTALRAARLVLLALVVSPPSDGRGQEAAPVVVTLGDGTAIVVTDGRAWRVRVVPLQGDAADPPAPQPPTPAPTPDSEAFRLGRDADVVGSVRANLARAFRETGEAAGTFADVQALVNAHADTLRRVVGDDLPITRKARDDFERLYQSAWSAGAKTPAALAPLWLDYAKGLEVPK